MATEVRGTFLQDLEEPQRGEIVQRHPLRDSLLYFAVAMAVVTTVIALVIHDSERGIHRNFKNNWFVGLAAIQPVDFEVVE